MQVIGIFALVASLVFVGLQMRQEQKIALADQYQSRAEAAQNMYMSMQESGISLANIGGDAAISGLTPAELVAVDNLSRWAWTQYDNHFYQYKAGFLDDESWQGLSSRIEQIYGACDRRIVWEQMQGFLRPSFVQYVDQLHDPCETTSR